MRPIENKCMLISYANSFGKNLKEMEYLLDKHFRGILEGVHILPFFPSSGDRGFAVVNYDIVDPEFGTWEDIDRLGEKYYLAADFMLNHVSIRCEEFKDYMKNGDASPYRNMFIHWDEFWPNGEPTEEELKALYSRKAQGPYMEFTRDDGKTVRLWNTFFQEQIDIDPYSEATQEYYDRNLKRIAQHVPLVRFDAFAYASKVPGTNCFFVEPQVYDVLDISMKPLRETGTQMLAEIHENYIIQKKLAEKGHWVYDFALPLIVLHGLMTGRTDRLINWLHICPHNQFTTLDTHDGIGVVDARYLLEEDEIELVCDSVLDHLVDGWEKLPEDIKEKAPLMYNNITKDGKRVRYQLGGSFYSALHEDDDAYLLARLIQFFTPGIPQVYYVGFLAGETDYDILSKGGNGRELNRHNFTIEEIEERIQKPMLQKMYEVMRFRNSYDAFNGDFSTNDIENGLIEMIWTKGDLQTTLRADLRTKEWTISWKDETTGELKTITK